MKTIEQYIETEMSGKITRKRNSPLPALLVLLVGVGMLVLLGAAKMDDSLSATCLTIGLLGTALGLILTAMNITGAMSHFVYQPTRSRMREKKVYVSGDDYNAIVEAIASGDTQPLAAICPVVSSNSAVRVLASSDGECALVQAIRDQNGHFEPETEVCLFSGASAAAVHHLAFAHKVKGEN